MNPKLQDIADRIVALKKMADLTGTKTNRTQGALLLGLDPIEMSIVASLVSLKLQSSPESTDARQPM